VGARTRHPARSDARAGPQAELRPPPTFTLLGDQLEAVGLVRRQPDPIDGRRRVLVLTDQGWRSWSRLLERMQQRSALFTLTIEEQNQLLSLLQKVETNRAQIPTGFLI